MKRVLKALGRITGVLLIVGVPALVVWQQQAIFDWLKLRNYHPSAQVALLANETAMNSYSRKLFYVNDPKIDDKAAFSSHCGSGEQTIVLGCFVSHHGIYIYDVKDERLRGVHEVTAAHETLHAAYERLSKKDRANVDRMVTDAFANMHDERLSGTIEAYRKKDPSVVPNELHSILGTEVRTLPDELEAYYKRYFTDRSKIVSFSEQYEQAFTERENKIKEYDAKLAELKPKIESGEDGLHSQLAVLQSQKAVLDAAIARGDIKAYNAAIPAYNAKVAAYNKLLNQVKANINTYNQMVKERNSIADEEKSLIQAIDSRQQPVQ